MMRILRLTALLAIGLAMAYAFADAAEPSRTTTRKVDSCVPASTAGEVGAHEYDPLTAHSIGVGELAGVSY